MKDEHSNSRMNCFLIIAVNTAVTGTQNGPCLIAFGLYTCTLEMYTLYCTYVYLHNEYTL